MLTAAQHISASATTHGSPRVRRRTATAAVLVLLAVTGGLTSTARPASAAPPITASPTTGLVDGDLVHVNVTGLTPGRSAVVVECSVAVGLLENCQALFVGATDASGALSVTVRIFAVVGTESGGFDCRTATTCVIDAYEGGGALGVGTSVSLDFDPAAPLGPPPAFTATPSAGVHAGDAITLTGSGLNADVDTAVFRCNPAVFEGGSLGCDTNDAQLVHTDATGSFVAVVPLATTFSTDAYTGGFPPTVTCGTATCVVFALTPALPDTALLASVDYLAAPTVAVTPSVGLLDGSFVGVRGSDFEPNAIVVVDECGSASGPCRSLRILNADETGHIDTSVRVFALIDEGGRLVDCRVIAAACGIGAHEYVDEAGAYRSRAQPVSFDPTGALAPPPTFTVAPDTGVVAGALLTIEGTGLNPDQTMTVHECPLIGPGGRCALEPVTTVRTDSAGTFRVIAPFPLLSASHQSWIRAPAGTANRPCGANEVCEHLGIYPAGPDNGMLATLGLATPAPTSSPASPVIASAPFAG